MLDIFNVRPKKVSGHTELAEAHFCENSGQQNIKKKRKNIKKLIKTLIKNIIKKIIEKIIKTIIKKISKKINLKIIETFGSPKTQLDKGAMLKRIKNFQ